MKKVLIHCRQTIESWYALPNSQRFGNSNIWLPISNRLRTGPRTVEPEVWFRFVHFAKDVQSDDRVATYSEQTVEIALGPAGV